MRLTGMIGPAEAVEAWFIVQAVIEEFFGKRRTVAAGVIKVGRIGDGGPDDGRDIVAPIVGIIVGDGTDDLENIGEVCGSSGSSG